MFGGKNEWFKILVEAPKVEKFVDRQKQAFTSVDSREQVSLPAAQYHHQSGYAGPNPDDHKLHTAHVIGAWASIFIAFTGVFIAFLMYIRKSIKPLADTFPGTTALLKAKYNFDHFYIDVLIKQGLLNLNRFLAWLDMGVYDRYAVDGVAVVNRVIFKASKGQSLWKSAVSSERFQVSWN